MRNKRTLVVVSVFIGLAVLGVLVALFTVGEVPFKSSSLSRSLIGHRAVVELLRRNGFQITINRRTQPQPEKGEGLVVFAPSPPEHQEDKQVSWRRLTDQFRPQLVVVPKWRGVRHPKNEHWVLITERFENSEIEQVIPDGTGWGIEFEEASEGGEETAGNPYTIRSQTGKTYSVRSQGLQYFQSKEVGTVLWQVDDRPVVIREPDTGRVWVSDPDLLSNMFLAEARNAGFAVSLFRTVFHERRFIVDELFRGYGIQESLLEILFTFPGLILTLNLTFLMLCFYWWLYSSWSGRQREKDEERSRLEQADAMGRLTHAHGQHAYAGRLYVSNLRTLTAETINLPEDAGWGRIVERLDSLRPALAEELRSIQDDLTRLNEPDPDQRTIVHVARQVNHVYDRLRHGVREGAEGPASDGN